MFHSECERHAKVVKKRWNDKLETHAKKNDRIDGTKAICKPKQPTATTSRQRRSVARNRREEDEDEVDEEEDFLGFLIELEAVIHEIVMEGDNNSTGMIISKII